MPLRSRGGSVVYYDVHARRARSAVAAIRNPSPNRGKSAIGGERVFAGACGFNLGRVRGFVLSAVYTSQSA